MKRKIQFKLNKRIFAVEVEDGDQNYEDLISDAFCKLDNQIQANNETIRHIFFDELEVVCSECGISLTNGEEDDATMCLQCEANKNKTKSKNKSRGKK